MNSLKGNTTPKKEFKDDLWPKIKRWCYEKFSNGQRVQDAAVDEWPEVYRKGDDTIIVLAKYLTPERYLYREEFIKIILGSCGLIILFGLFWCRNTLPTGIPFGAYFTVFSGVFLLLLFAILRDKIFRQLYSKRTKIILKPDRVIIRGGAQGNRTLASSPEVCLPVCPHCPAYQDQ
jgi:hypothetical protein